MSQRQTFGVDTSEDIMTGTPAAKVASHSVVTPSISSAPEYQFITPPASPIKAVRQRAPVSPVKRKREMPINDVPEAKSKQQENEENRAPIKSAKASVAKSIFKGQSKKKYEHISEYMKNRSGDENEFNDLGCITSDAALYFAEGTANEFAADFLTHFWESEEFLTTTKSLVEAKFADGSFNKEKSPQIPPCLSFVSTVIGDRDHYIIALSGKESKPKEAITAAFVKFLKDYRYNQEPVAFLGGNIDDFNRLLGQVSGNEDPRFIQKPCAEKFITSYLTKQMFKFKGDLKVQGVVNCAFYPYPNNPMVFDRERVQMIPDPVGTLQLGDFYAAKIDCCDNCKVLKTPYLQTLNGARTAPSGHEISPVKVKNPTSFSPNSRVTLFGEKKAPSKKAEREVLTAKRLNFSLQE